MAASSASSSTIDTIAAQLLTDLDETQRVMTATDLYRLGLVLFNLSSLSSYQHQEASQRALVENVRDATRAVLQELSEKTRKGLFDDLLEALQELGKQHRHDEQYHELANALESFVGIWWLLLNSVTPQRQRPQRLQQQRWPNELETSLYLIQLYQKPHFSPQQTCRKLILEFLSLVWLSPIQSDKQTADTAISASSSSKHLEDFLTVLNALQEDDVVWEDLVKHHQEQPDLSISWRRELAESFTQNSVDDATQRDYLSSLLLYENTEPKKTSILMPSTSPTRPTTRAAKSLPTRKKDPMQERIDQVRAVIPDVGEGFVEIALSLYQGDAQRAISALLEPELPPGLQYVDRKLPRRKNPNAMKNAMMDDDNDEDAQVAKQVTKKALQETERRAAAEAAAIYYVLKTDPDVSNTNNKETGVVHHDEYDDEYDDQWDDLGGTAGADDGLYDRLDSGGVSGAGAGDYQAVMTYNRAVKQVEEEQSFWDHQRNTNRTAAANNGAAGKNYRGPDKIKGGRVPDQRGGRGRGGGRGNRGAKGKNDNSNGTGENNSGGRGGGGPNKNATSDSGNNNNMPNQRHKANKLASRRERQKQSMNKRSGGM